MDCMDVIRQRRSIRRYQARDVPETTLRQVLEAVRWAPSWGNTQCWELVIIKDSSVKEEIRLTLSPKNPALPAIVAAPVLVVVCGRLHRAGFKQGGYPTKHGDWFMYDLGLVTQTLCLAAHDHGLGTVIVGMFDHDRVGKIIGLPQGCEVAVLVPLGFPAQTPAPPKRRQQSDYVHHTVFPVSD